MSNLQDHHFQRHRINVDRMTELIYVKTKDCVIAVGTLYLNYSYDLLCLFFLPLATSLKTCDRFRVIEDQIPLLNSIINRAH